MTSVVHFVPFKEVKRFIVYFNIQDPAAICHLCSLLRPDSRTYNDNYCIKILSHTFYL